MQPRLNIVRPSSSTDDLSVGPAVEPRSWAPRVVEADRSWQEAAADVRPTFTHNAARYSRSAEATQPVEHVDLEPELSPPPRWMMALAGAAVAALMGALLGGFMHI